MSTDVHATVDADRPLRLTARQKFWCVTALKIGLSSLAIVLVVANVDLSSAWRRAANQNFRLVLLAGGIMAFQIAMGGLRWHCVLRSLRAPVSVRDSLRLFYISVFFNACLGGVVGGDLVRAWLARRGQVSAGTAVLSVVLDRAAALAGVGLLVLATAPFFAALVGGSMIVFVPLILAAGGLVGIAATAQLDRLPLRWQRFWPVRLLHRLGGATREVFLRPASAALALGLAIVAQTAMAVCAYVLAASLDIDLSLIDCLLLMQPVALIAALPISIGGGWGVREAAMVGVLGLVGVPTGAALMLSVQLGVLAMIVSLPGGLLWLLDRKAAGAGA